MNLHWSNSFVNRTRLPLLCEKFRAILLVLVDLLVGRQAGRQSDEILVDFEFLKFSIDRIVRIFMALTQRCSVIIVLPTPVAMHYSWLFWVKYIVRHIMEVGKSGTPCFLCLLST